MKIAAEISPNLRAIVVQLGWAYLEAGKSDKAAEYYQQEIVTHREWPELLYYLAGVYERQQEFESALSTLDQLVEKDPDNRDAVLMAHKIALKAGFGDRARDYLTDWLKWHPDDEGAKRALAETGSD